MNRLDSNKQATILRMLCEGASINSVSRIMQVSKVTVLKLITDTGTICERILADKMQGLALEHLEVDELWCFVQKKEGAMTRIDNPDEVGDKYVFVAIDSRTKLVPLFVVGRRNPETSILFLSQLNKIMASRFQLSTDGFYGYTTNVRKIFGDKVDYSTVTKVYRGKTRYEGRQVYTPGEFLTVQKRKVSGDPVMSRASTSIIERQNLTLRMRSRRFTRLTNGHSKTLRHLTAALSIHYVAYNFLTTHQSLGTTPAVSAGLEIRQWDWSDVLNYGR